MKIIALSDLHCGHLLGLTPENWQRKNWKLEKVMAQFWDWFCKNIPEKSDVAIWNGDLVEGEGKKESNHHLTTDIHEQTEMAIEIIKKVGAKKNIFTFGTSYHVGSIMDYEAVIAEHFGADIKYRQKIEIGGMKFDIMHHPGGKSGTPVGGDIALRKSTIWSMLYDQMDGRDHADILIRSHVHEYRFLGNSMIKAVVLPALKIGKPDYDRYARRLDGWYDVGFVTFEYKKGDSPLLVYPAPYLFKYEVSGGYKKI